jgi:hypothetical protein
MNEAYTQVKAEAEAMGETNDCVVRAISIAAQLPYNEAHTICARAGRKPRHGMHTRRAIEVLNQLDNYHTDMIVPRKPGGGRYTVKTIGRAFPRGRYVCVVSGHALAIVDGEVCDWTNGRQHRVKFMFKVENSNAPASVETPKPRVAKPSALMPTAPRHGFQTTHKVPPHKGLPKQAFIIANTLLRYTNGRLVTMEQLVELLKPRLATKQPIERVVKYYLNRLVSEGYITVR